MKSTLKTQNHRMGSHCEYPLSDLTQKIIEGSTVGVHRLDLVVEDRVVVELKSVKLSVAEDIKRLLSYLKATGKKVGLLMSFAKPGIAIKRFVL